MKRTSWITWRIYLLTIPIDVIVLIFAADHELNTWRDFYMWGLVALIAHLGISPLALLAINQSQAQSKWQIDLAYLILLGTFRGLLISVCAVWLNLSLEVSAIYKIFNSAIALPQWFVGVAIFIESRRFFQQEFHKLFSQAVEKRVETKLTGNILDDLVAPQDESLARLQVITSNLSGEIRELLDRPRDLHEYVVEAEKIRNLLDNHMKPTSLAMWKKSKIKAPRIPLRTLLSIVFLEKNLKVPLLLIISIPYLFVGLNGVYSFELSVVQCAFIALFDLIVYFLFESFHKMKFMGRRTTNVSIILISTIMPLFFQLQVIPDRFLLSNTFLDTVVYQSFLSSSFVAVLLIINGYGQIKTYRSEVIRRLAKHIDSIQYSKLVDTEASEHKYSQLAQYLHGEVQAELTASSLLLQQAVQQGDSELAKEALERASTLLNQDMGAIPLTRMAPSEEKIRKLVNAWKGIAEIDIAMPPYDQINPITFRENVQLIEESVANSIRHAKANKIEIKVSNEGNLLKTVIASNGAPLIKGKSGLGTKLFNELCTQWNHHSENGLNYLIFFQLNED